MMPINLEPINSADQAALLEINNRFSVEICEDSPESFAGLVEASQWGRHIERRAFLIALDQDTSEGGYNIDYLKDKFEHFLYVDRIAVDPSAQGQGFGVRLYEGLIAYGTQAGYPVIYCEINIDPPNPGSVVFHERLGFEAFGTPRLLPNGKTVQYFRLGLKKGLQSGSDSA